ncbi:hypothetical protein F5Y05DRAFT_409612 [Hypoxylon sp. FL0543]|nr:hypothetical protein F5Y05DRAFT_409612 [Hypoxylon sp. FL0543]
MKVSTAVVFAAAAVPGAIADFWMVYLSRKVHGDAPLIDSIPDGDGCAFVDNPELTCEGDAGTHSIYDNSGDVSGKKLGMRTVPGNDVGFPLYREPLDVVEFNVGGNYETGHQTIYKDRGYALVNLVDAKTGQCYVNRTFIYDMDCHLDDHHIILKGSSMFFCQSDITHPGTDRLV